MGSEDVHFDFVCLLNKHSPLEKKDIQDNLMKWSMKSMRINYFNFNQPFKFNQKEEFVNCFFRSPHIYMNLQSLRNGSWSVVGEPADKIEIQVVPCSVTSMSFLDPVTDPKHGIVRSDKNTIIQMFEEEIDSFYVSDKLRQCVLVEGNGDCDDPFTPLQRQQFLFRLFKHLALGGQWCQQDDIIEPYLDMSRHLYKQLISVERSGESSDLTVRSLVLKVVAFVNQKPLVPTDPHHVQNFLYLIIDPFNRQVTTLLHQYDAPFTM